MEPLPHHGKLADGSPPATPQDLLRRLHELGIPCATMDHAPVYTVEEARVVRGDIPGAHTKNLFLRDKKGRRMWLVTCLADREVDLRALAGRLHCSTRLSFGSPERLMKYLGVLPGAVSPLAVVNDRGRVVRVVLDRCLLEHDPINFHPLDNAKTTSLAADDFLRFLEAEGHPAEIVDFDRL
jgi:Ala-tRNA(Pro) deacylase